MTSVPSTSRPPQRTLAGIFLVIILCWALVVFVNLYFFGYASMDTWCYCAPAAMARLPFALTTPFLGSFEGADKAWGFHWPGGPLLTSIVTPFLPHAPATYILISMGYWLLLSLAVAALVRRMTANPWLGLYAFLFVVSDRLCFSMTWFERYELLGGAIAITAIMALYDRQDRHGGVRSAIIGAAFFLLPLIHPLFSGVGLAWITYLGFRTFVLKRPWKQFCIAAAGYAAGWATFLGYYWSRPWLYAQFLDRAHVILELTRVSPPHGIRLFLMRLYETDRPFRAGAIVYGIAFGGVLSLLYGLWKSRGDLREFLAREDLAICAALALVSTLVLSQKTYNGTYWAAAWPFAVALACLVIHRVLQRFPGRRRLLVGALLALLLLHGAFWAGRTYIWYKTGFVNLRGRLQEFASTLPQGGQLFIPEVLWDTYADGNRKVILNSLPYIAGTPAEQRYAAYIRPQIQSGDVLVVDQLQSNLPLIDTAQPGWKQIGECNVTYQGEDKLHGYQLTAYQKQ
jgi:hypothetical protein